MNANNKEETIIALVTKPGVSGIGIIRTSGYISNKLAIKLLGKIPEPRKAELLCFYDSDKTIIDKGIALFFPKPNSFTGEDVLELQGHGNPILLDSIMQNIIKTTGIRIANPGEFLKRAFLNNKIDLAQAEAIADIIKATSLKAVKCAINSMLGTYSEEVNNIINLITKARINIESNISFTEDVISKRKINNLINKALLEIKGLYNKTKATNKLQKGKSIVIAGEPNTGKSSIFNTITEKDTAIVTELAGTTRDVLYDNIGISGIPLNIIDTAGIQKTKDKVEKIGIKKAWDEVKKADHILLVKTNLNKEHKEHKESIIPNKIIKYISERNITIIINKIDLTQEKASIKAINNSYNIIKLSAKTGEGISFLKEHLRTIIKADEAIVSNYLMNKRHISILKTTIKLLIKAYKNHKENINDLIAEDVAFAERELYRLTGEPKSTYILTESMLNTIFSGLCVGK